jgi:hypothetical protein
VHSPPPPTPPLYCVSLAWEAVGWEFVGCLRVWVGVDFYLKKYATEKNRVKIFIGRKNKNKKKKKAKKYFFFLK